MPPDPDSGGAKTQAGCRITTPRGVARICVTRLRYSTRRTQHTCVRRAPSVVSTRAHAVPSEKGPDCRRRPYDTHESRRGCDDRDLQRGLSRASGAAWIAVQVPATLQAQTLFSRIAASGVITSSSSFVSSTPPLSCELTSVASWFEARERRLGPAGTTRLLKPTDSVRSAAKRSMLPAVGASLVCRGLVHHPSSDCRSR